MPSTDPARPREVLTATREVLEAETGRLANLIGRERRRRRRLRPHVDAGCPYIEIGDDGQVHWIVKKRGQLLEHRTTGDADELLYWSFETTTFSLASHWEARHRDESKDFRVGLWAKQAELLHRLNPLWAQRWRRELAERQPRDIGLMPELPSRPPTPRSATRRPEAPRSTGWQPGPPSRARILDQARQLELLP